MAKFCSNCGSEVNENAAYCLKCGVAINNYNNLQTNSLSNQTNISNYSNTKIPGKGLSIAGMVLGIIGAAWVLIKLITVGSIETDLSYNFFTYYESSFIVGYAIGYTLFSLIPSIIGVILSILGFKKSKSGFNISGLILNGIALVISVILFIYILTFI